MKNFHLLIFMVLSNFLFAQEITLDDCYLLAKKNFSYDKQMQLNSESSDYTIENLNTIYYPSLDLIAQASYQSTAIEINLPIPGVEMPKVPLDQYKAYLELTQVIYAGGAIKSKKETEQISLQVENMNLEVEFQTIKEQINDVYFLILLLSKQEEIVDILMKNLETRLAVVESAVKNGILIQVDYDVILAEKLKVEQQVIELDEGQKSALKILSNLTDTVFDESSVFQYPEIEINLNDTSINRAEFKLIDISQNQISAYSGLLNSQRKPQIVAFAQAGYGRPGLNMLSSDFNPYFITGISASWNIWDWNSTSREKQILKVSSDILQIQKDNLAKTINIELQTQISNIEKIEQQILKDEEIIELRNKIITAYASQLENGTISSSEYIVELNAVTEAKLNLELHKIQLLEAKVEYLTAKGN